jgi:hypothetical protein
MTNTQATPALPTDAAHKFAYILATIHSSLLTGDEKMALNLVKSLPIAMEDLDLGDIYYGAAVDEYLDMIYPILYPNDPELSDEDAKILKDMFQAILPEEEEEEEDESGLTAVELREGTCGNPDCGCNDPDDGEEVLVPTWINADGTVDFDRLAEEIEALEQQYPDQEVIHEEEDFVIIKLWK